MKPIKSIINEEGLKFCTCCEIFKDPTLFNYQYKDTKKLKAKCKQCESLLHKTKYGITVEEYKALLLVQNYKCKICGGTNDNGRELYVDHCHVTNKVRGLLCSNCNTALGKFQDNPYILKKAIEYLLQ